MSLLAVTVIGHDRPGIIAEVTGLLGEVRGNLEDSTMTILRGHFAMTLIVSTESSATVVEQVLRPVAADGSLLVTVREVAPEQDVPSLGPGWVLSVHGADRPGIVSAMTQVVAQAGGNITDLTTRLAGDLYVVVAEVDLPVTVDADALAVRLRATADALGVGASLRPVATDVL